MFIPRMFSILLAALVWAMAAIAHAQPYPSKPVTLVVPYPPGGYDAVARLFALRLTERMGQNFLVDNRPGAGGTIAMGQVARAPADGYTLVVGGSSDLMITPHISRTQKLSYDPLKDFIPVAILGKFAIVLVAHRGFNGNTVQEFVALAKASPGKLTYGSSGVGTTGHIAAEMFKSLAGIDIVHVPFKGSTPAATALLGGHVNVQFGAIGSQHVHVKEGRLKILAISQRARSESLPDVPTFAESGYPDYEIQGWVGLLAPAGTPIGVIRSLNQAIVAISGDPRMRKELASIAYDTSLLSIDALRESIREDAPKYEKAVKASGAVAD